MALVRWQPWQEIDALRRQFDQLFDDIVPSNSTASLTNRNLWQPAIELKNTDAAVILRAELPGVDAQDLNVQVTRDAVSIAGEYRSKAKTEDARFVRSEFRYGSFHRVVPLPSAVKNDQVKAEFKDGILTLTLPKVSADRPQVVKINLNPANSAAALESDNSPAADLPEQSKTVAAESEDVWSETHQS